MLVTVTPLGGGTLPAGGTLRGGGGRRHGHYQRDAQEEGEDRACAPVRHAPILPRRRESH
jgi:hypothetical protein